MGQWEVMVYVDRDGNCPFEDWVASRAVTTKDAAKIDARVRTIEDISDDLPPEWFSKYLSSDGLSKLRVRGPGRKQLRPLGVRDGKRRIVLFYGSVEKGDNLKPRDISKAEALKKKWEKGEGHVKKYLED